jgi:hypothetical protein
MNINTNMLLNTLLSKVDSTLKAKIEKHSIDGKVDISSLGKEKGIGTLLNQLFKDVSTGSKNKTEVSNILENSKKSLKFKNISSELKQVIDLISKELKNTPEITKLTSLLKTSLVDIKNIDEKIIKSSFQNSGVFLESKLSKSNDSVSTNLKNLLNQFTDTVKILNSLDKTISNIDPKALKVSPSPEIKSNSLFQNTFTLSNEVKSDVKSDVQSVLKKIEIAQPLPQVEKQLSSLKSVVTDIKNLEQKFIRLDIKNDVTSNLKELVHQVKNNLLNNSSQSVDKTLFLIKNQLESIDSIDLLEIKKDVKNLDVKVDKLHSEKNIESKIVIIKDLIQNTTILESKINIGNIKELLKNDIGNLKNISSDLKSVMSQIKETIEQPQNTETLSKELKNTVDKILTQIDYYQLSSYSSNSNHSYLSFLQDDLEDVDIKFNNKSTEDFSCLIHLSLKEKGELKILLQLDKKNGININIGVEQKEFKLMIQDALQKLRVQINSLGLSIMSLNIFDLNENIEKNSELKAYSNNQNIDFGLDIKV